MPPISGVFRKDASEPIPDVGGGLHSDVVTDNTCDGFVRPIISENGTPTDVPISPAVVIVTTPDFAPDWDDDPDLGPNFEKNLLQVLQGVLAFPNVAPVTPINATARELDRAFLQSGTGDFAPGIEMNKPDVAMFESVGTTGDADEARIAEGSVEPGDLTFNLCSPWQYDFKACGCSFWANHRPDVAFKDEPNGPEVNWRRKIANDISPTAPKINSRKAVSYTHLTLPTKA